MITKDDVKGYLHIPYNDEDALIATMIAAGYQYLANAIDDYAKLSHATKGDEGFKKLADYWVLTQWMPAAYDEREGMNSNAPALNYTARSMLTQLQMFEYVEEANQND